MFKIFDNTVLGLYGPLHSLFGLAYLIWGLYYYIDMPPIINNATTK